MKMDSRTARSLMLVAVVVGAAVIAVFASPPPPAPPPPPSPPSASTVERAAAPADQTEMPPMDDPMEPGLPPNHPPVGADPDPLGADKEAITWHVPATWRSTPNASDMLLASYRVAARDATDQADVTVVRASGSAADAAQRWIGQFDKNAKQKRTERTVHGLKLTTVEVIGTITSAGGMGAAPETVQRPGWALLGAIVETEGSPYFFKLLGPVATVGAARADFQALVESVTPSPSSPQAPKAP